jgi:predicted Zn-dependent protease
MFLNRNDAEQIARRALSLSSAESCFVWLSGREDRNIRFASRGGATNATTSGVQVTITTTFGQRQGRASANAIDDDSLRDAVSRAETAARLSPENPETMPPLGRLPYPPSAAYNEATASLTIDALAGLMEPAATMAQRAGVDIAGYTHLGKTWRAFANSAGAGAYDRATRLSLSLSTRNRAGTWSGWSGTASHDAAQIDAAALARTAIDKALAQPDPMTLEPGKYVVLLEPAVVGHFVAELMGRFNARPADEGRSFLARKGGGTRQGETMFSERVTIASDPANALAPGFAFDWNGLPNNPATWVERGVVRTLKRDRYWASKTGETPVADPGIYTMAGGTDSVADMIRSIKRGILVTRLWYVRGVDPRSVLLTGLTRDGTFLIENGAIAGPCTNFRFNESPLSLFKNVLGIGPTERTAPPEVWPTLAVPPILAENFSFTSISPAV